MDTIPWDAFGPSSGWAVVAYFCIQMARGKLVARSALDDKIHEANEWRTEGRVKDQQLAEKDVQIALLSEVGQTVDAIMRSIQRNARSGDVGSHQDQDDI